MKALEQALSERESVLELAEKRAREILDSYCRSNDFLLIGRLKTPDSLKDKLETGRYASLDAMDDIIAFSVVVDTIKQFDEVQEFLKKSFNVSMVKSKTTLRDERLFDFDCPRIYCCLIDRAGSGGGWDRITIEVQVRTILQHAWSKITHPLVYKASSFDARGGRLAAEVLAQIGSLDRTFDKFESATKHVKPVVRWDVSAGAFIIKKIDELVDNGAIPRELRPKNGRRLGDNIYSSIKWSERKDFKTIAGKICKFISEQTPYPRSISIYQLAIIALFQERMLDASDKRHYYVTDEMISLFPKSANIPNRIEIH